VRELALGLVARGHVCQVMVWSDASEAGPGPDVVEGVPVHRVARGYWPVLERFAPDSRDVWSLRRAVAGLHARERFDWIEAQNDEGMELGVLRDQRERVVLRIHTTLRQMVETKQVCDRWGHRWRLRREARAFACAPRVVTHLAAHAAELRRLYPVLPAAGIVPHGLDLPDLPRATPGARPRFLVVGTPDPRKGFDRLRPAMEAYAARHGAAEWTIVSQVGAAQRARFRLDPPLPAGASVVWAGTLERDAMHRLYAASDALFFPSRYESFGFPIIEAAGLGVPVVATAVGVAPDILRDGLAGLQIDGDDATACADALRWAWRERARLEPLLRAAYRAGYTRDAMVNRYLHVLQGFAAARSGHGRARGDANGG
jgi:D-inositol-3-phosphate glycosyltransferase